MQALALSVKRLRGWRLGLLVAGSGAASVLAMAPFFLWPVLFLTLPVLVWAVDGVLERASPASPGNPRASRSMPQLTLARGALRAAGIGWLFGFGYFVAGLFWVGEAFLVEADKFAILLPAAVTLLPAGLVLFWAGACGLAALAWQPGLGRVLALALTLAVAEWLRGHVLTGFPWNVLGYALTWPLPLMQSASLIGVYGLTLLAVLIFAAPLVLAGDVGAGRLSPAWRAGALLVALAPIALLFAYGTARLAMPEPVVGAPVRLRLVQPSVPQREKWRPENQDRIFAQHLDLSRRDPSGAEDGAAGIALIVWPEAAMPFLPLQAPAALAAIGRMLPDGTHLLSGALRLEAGPAGSRRIFNNLMAFGRGGQLIANYDKIHLVPFGEYLPLQATLEAIGLEQLVRLRGGFASGVEPRPLLAIPGLPELGPLICYEAIFPAEIVAGPARPQALVNVTNDGWFGNTTGPRQHLHQARVRAVEEGLPVLRSANNGISAVIDGKGRLTARLDLDQTGVIDAALPPALEPPPYARLGDRLFVLGLVLGSALLAGLRTRPGAPL